MTSGDGNGWVVCRCGHRHWGRYGAAGLLLVRPAGEDFEALLQLRASWTDHGGTWGLPGGAADSHEDATTAAAREAQEEAGVPPGALSVLGQVVSTDHGDWRYTVVIAVLATGHEDVTPHVANAESDEVRWVRSARALELPLHAGLAATWEELAASVGELLPVG